MATTIMTTATPAITAGMAEEVFALPSWSCAASCSSRDVSVLVIALLVSADHDVLDVEKVLHVWSVYPNAAAADLSISLRSAHFLNVDDGCTSAPEASSQEAWVYPSNAAACGRLISKPARWGAHWSRKFNRLVRFSASCLQKHFLCRAAHNSSGKNAATDISTCRHGQSRPWTLRQRDGAPRLLSVPQRCGRWPLCVTETSPCLRRRRRLCFGAWLIVPGSLGISQQCRCVLFSQLLGCTCSIARVQPK